MNAPRIPCDCGTLLTVKSNGKGGYSLHCVACKSQTFKKTPAAVAAFERKYGIAQRMAA